MTKNKKKKRADHPDDIALAYEQYKPELKGYIAKRVDSPQEAEDILQDVFYKLAGIDLLENPIEYVSAWLYQAAGNRIIDRARKKKEQSMPEIRPADDDDCFFDSLSDYLADSGDDPETVMRNELIMGEISVALGELPDRQRIVFELTEYDGFSYKEISESTGTPVATLISRKHYAVNHLRKRLRRLYADITGE